MPLQHNAHDEHDEHEEHDDLNPIFTYAAKGQHYAHRAEWEKSILWYQRSLASFPNLYGAVELKQRHGSANLRPQDFTPRHAGRLYSAMGHSLAAAGREKDSLLSFGAARHLDPDNLDAKNFMTRHARRKKSISAKAPSITDAPLNPPHPDMDMGENLTIVITTHCTDRLKKNRHLSPPSCKLVTAAYGSLLKTGDPDLRQCPKILCYDRNPRGGERDAAYHRSLEQFSRQHGFDLRLFTGAGLFNVLNSVIETIRTPYFFLLEHDWLFRGAPVDFKAIMEMMNNHLHMHAIRFNKRENQIDGHDFIMTTNGKAESLPLLKTSSFSNNPSILRTAKFKQTWLPICQEALRHVSHQLGGSAFGVEEILFKQFVQDIRYLGFEKAHQRWGTYVLGRAGDPARIIHLGE